MRKYLIFLCVALLLHGTFAAVFIRTSVAQPTDNAARADLSTPQKTVESFFAALNRGDIRGMVPCVLEAEASPDIDQLQKDYNNRPTTGKLVLSNIKVYTDEAGTESMVAFELRFDGESGLLPGKTDEVLRVRKTGEGWKIVAPAPGSFDGRNSGRGMSEATSLVLLVRYPDAIRKARLAAQSALTLSKAKQVCLGLMMYVQDYDEIFVPNADTYVKAIQPYVKNNEMFTSALDPAGTVSFKFNPQLARKSLAKINEPANTVMIYEGEYKKLLFRYDGKAIIGFIDGHVKLVTPEEAKKLRWSP